MRAPNRFYLEGKLASGQEITVRLGGPPEFRPMRRRH
jgi:hypothetical protein